MLALLLIAGCGGGNGGSSASGTRSAAPHRAPVSVARRHLRYMAEAIVSELRQESDLTGDQDDYSAKCRQTGKDRATCMITSYDVRGRKIMTYPTRGRFDPANPYRFEFPDAGTGVTSPRGKP